MSLSGAYNVIISALGISIQGTTNTVEGKQGIDPADVVVPAAKAVTDWVNAGATAADCNLPAGHGFTDGKFDVFWTASGVAKRRYGVNGSITTNAMTLDGGDGDDFPATADTTVVVCPQTALDETFDGDNLVLIGASSTRGGLLLFRDATGSLVGDPVDLLAGVPWGWATGRGTNPLAGNAVASASISNSSTAGTAQFKLTGLQYAA